MIKGCQSFVGMVNFVSIFCPKLQRLLKPIYDSTRKGKQFLWEEEQQKAFDEIKCRLQRPPVLHLPNRYGRFQLYSDTSKFATGSVLYQIQNGQPRLIAYASKRMPEATKNYSITELEMCGLATFSHLLKKVDFDVVVDHLAITHIMRSKAEPATTRIKRLLELLSPYSFNLYYIKGQGQGQMWHKYLPLVTFTHNMFNSPNLANHSPYKLVFGRKAKLLLDLGTDPDVKVSGTYREYILQLRKRLGYLHKLLQDFQMKRIALINKDRGDFQYNNRDLIYIILPLTIQLRTASRNVSIKYVGPLAVYKIVDPHNYLLITLDGKLLRGLFEHERVKPAVIRTNQGNVTNLSKLKQVMSSGLLLP